MWVFGINFCSAHLYLCPLYAKDRDRQTNRGRQREREGGMGERRKEWEHREMVRNCPGKKLTAFTHVARKQATQDRWIFKDLFEYSWSAGEYNEVEKLKGLCTTGNETGDFCSARRRSLQGSNPALHWAAGVWICFPAWICVWYWMIDIVSNVAMLLIVIDIVSNVAIYMLLIVMI